MVSFSESLTEVCLKWWMILLNSGTKNRLYMYENKKTSITTTIINNNDKCNCNLMNQNNNNTVLLLSYTVC